MRYPYRNNRLLLLLLFTAWINSLEAQLNPAGSVTTELVNKYVRYHQREREAIYTHFNKNIFFPGEEIWFNCYIVDALKHTPFLGTKNVYAELYDSSGNCIRRQILYAYGGVANGYFSLPDSIRSGIYFFKAYTSWSRNFTEAVSFIQPLIISRKAVANTKTEIVAPLKMDFFPEGGCFLTDAENRMVTRITDSRGYAVLAKGEIVTDGKVSGTFTTNNAGIGHCNINAVAGKKYTARVLLKNGQVEEFALPAVKETGISLSVERNTPDSITIFVNSNIQSRPLLTKNFYLLIHRQGVVADLYEFNFGNQRRLRFGQSVAALSEGVAYVSLFDSNYKLLSERPVYIRRVVNQHVSLEVETVMIRDSVEITIIAKDGTGRPVKANFSMSVLPGVSEAGHFNGNILSAVGFENEAGRVIDGAADYLRISKEKSTVELDDMLMMEGYAYDWEKIFKDWPAKFPHQFEQGFNISGTVPGFQMKRPEDSLCLTLMAAENSLFITKPVNDKGQFEFPYLFLTDSANVYLYASTVKDKRKFKNLELHLIVPNFDSAAIPASLKRGLPVDIPADEFRNANDPEFLSLEEVRVKSKGRKKNPLQANVFSMVTDRLYVVDESTERKYKSLLDLLKGEFLLRFFRDSARNLQVDMGRGPISFRETIDQPVLIVDGMAMFDLNVLNTININMIEAIAVNKTGNSTLGMRGAAGSIFIKTKEFYYGPETNDQGTLIKKFPVKGYTIPPVYFPHLYTIPVTDSLLMKYAALYWKPDLQTDENGKATFRFYCPKNTGGIMMRSEGITRDGQLLFDERRVGF